MKRLLIVNADDCNLTPGVTCAILDCHDRGIVTSTSVLVNLPFPRGRVNALLKRKRLGLGLHLNVTFGRPVSQISSVRSLVNREGIFFRPERYLRQKPRADEIDAEYERQIKKFREIFGRYPTHLDTHHQMHDREIFYRVLLKLASRYRIPVRRSCRMKSKAVWGSVKTTDHVFGYLSSKKNWTPAKLRKTLRELPAGVSEIFCHPGRNDAALCAVSSLTGGRQSDAAVFASHKAKMWIRENGIRLVHFGML